jgi:hypothetical protein
MPLVPLTKLPRCRTVLHGQQRWLLLVIRAWHWT